MTLEASPACRLSAPALDEAALIQPIRPLLCYLLWALLPPLPPPLALFFASFLHGVDILANQEVLVPCATHSPPTLRPPDQLSAEGGLHEGYQPSDSEWLCIVRQHGE
ncbi:hypothetical protein BDZ90DRAFT_188004 [Jaminaea rosea]|uniref:Uncharacterized protein n=1 Tax=Jaminaea rosea TaxID=1569628 RepID=A0A316UTI2_9BASI|nr:hypothetical protein BDZ90DRAFT_188004 [Jaminaea rosea]PWN27213.1 hypothetical protein BDZ90DRAFT_188004 [Jaminaea rosea]